MEQPPRKRSKLFTSLVAGMGNKQQGGQESQMELSKNFKSFLGAKVLWPAEITDDVMEAAIRETQSALRDYDAQVEGEKIAEYLKNYMDENFEPNWHVTFGENFGCFATHEKKRFLFFYINKLAFLFFKIG